MLRQAKEFRFGGKDRGLANYKVGARNRESVLRAQPVGGSL